MRYIIVDGLDGSGKDTHANLIMEKYLSKGENVIVRTHPSNDNPYGIKAKKALLGKGKIKDKKLRDIHLDTCSIDDFGEFKKFIEIN